MSRGTQRPEPALDALRAAVAASGGEERARQARAALTARDLGEPGLRLRARVSGRGGRLRAGLPGPRAHPGGPPPTEEHVRQAAASYALVQQAQAGDAEAFAQLYDRYLPEVYRYVACRVASRHVAEDLTADTFVKGLRSIGSFSWQGSDVGAWFVTIARNIVIDHYKSGRYRLEVATDDVSAVGTPGVVDGPESAVLADLDTRTLLEAVRKLNPEQQECIALRFLQELSVSETALVMGKNEAAVRALQYRAVRALSRLLPPRPGA
ncbi:MAG TPA: sigma-70 family RNA polymerase sigma factor [Mycobacteriales bacterium]|nr:sigma-70 family RNA polymerase sigma factor [Mycobacteriales bacterium]